MQISHVSNTTAVAATQGSQAPVKNSGTAQTPTDTVQLSSAAQAQLNGAGDVDHDGDSH